MEDNDTAEFEWIPVRCQGNIRFVTSTTREGNTLDLLDKRAPSALKIPLSDLNESAKRDIVKNYFGRYNKVSFIRGQKKDKQNRKPQWALEFVCRQNDDRLLV